MVEIRIRRYEGRDAPQAVAVFRDANNSIRKSRGGAHPDSEVDALLSKSDAELLSIITHGSVIFVAEVAGTGEIAGMGAITNNLVARMLGSTYSKNHYVKEAFQHGKAGVSLGRPLRDATLAEAKRLGFRKMYGFSTPESVGFHKKFGAVFHPRYNTRMFGTVIVEYYEIELRKSVLNGIRMEPYAVMLGRAYGWLLGFLPRRQ